MNEIAPLVIEYHREKTTGIGYFVIQDQTKALFRHNNELNFELRLYQLDNGQRTECPTQALLVSSIDAEGSQERKYVDFANVYSIPVSTTINVGDLKFLVQLDMSQLDPVYQRTRFIVEVNVDDQGKRQTDKRELEFFIEENKEKAFMVIEDQLSADGTGKVIYKGTENFIQESVDEQNNLPTIQIANKIKHVHSGTTDLLELKLFNSATHAADNEAEPSNCILISKIEAHVGAANPELITLEITDQDERFIDTDNHEISLLPREQHYLSLRLRLNQNLDREYYDNKNYRAWIGIEVDISNGVDSVEGTAPYVINIPVSFSCTPDLSGEVVAFDFGTSANAAYQYTKGKSQLINLYELYKGFSADKYVARVKSTDAFKSTIDSLKRKGRNCSKESSPLISNVFYRITDPEDKSKPPVYDLEAIVNTDISLQFETVKELKSRIASSQIDYTFEDGSQMKVANLLQEAYKLLHHDYFMPARAGKAVDRLVVTHPNSYVSGQIQFLKDHIQESLQVGEVLTVSESDAVIYDYLQGIQNSEEQFSGLDENILCYDMGAGTLDISFRRVKFQMDGDIRNPLKDDSSELLNMLSVFGAGNELDGIIAQMIEAKLVLLESAFDAFYKEKGSNKKFNRVSLLQLQKNENTVAQAAQLNIIDRVRDAIREGKADYSESVGHGYVISFQTEFEGVMYFDLGQEFVRKMDEEEFWKNNGIEYKTNTIDVHLNYQEIDESLAQGYLLKHVLEPIEVATSDENGNQIPVNTAIISGRGAIYPNVRALLEKTIRAKYPAVNIISAAQNPTKMKTMVAEGALAWGRDAGYGETLFNTPFMHGVLGVATFDKNGLWHWQTLIHNRELKCAEQITTSARSDAIYPRRLKKMMILQSSICNSAAIEKMLDVLSNTPELIIENLHQSDYFNLIESFDNPANDFSDSDDIKITVRPLNPSDSKKHYGAFEQKYGYLNLRVQVTVHSSNSKGSWNMDPVDISSKADIKLKQYWPATLEV